jgi:hypothetical protein
MRWCDALIIAGWALLFGALGFFAVAFVEARSVDETSLRRYLRREGLSLSEHLRTKLWKPLLGGACAATLAGGSAAEDVIDGLGEDLETHPVLISALTGAVLAVIVVLVIEALFKMVATTAWVGLLRATWISVVKGGRRGATDLQTPLGGSKNARVEDRSLPDPGDPAVAAYDVARELSVGLEGRVINASLAAFASEHPELGEAMQRLSTAADTLQRALERYSSDTPSHTGEPRKPEHIVAMWRDYAVCLLDVDKRGRALGFRSPMNGASRCWLARECEGHTRSEWLKDAMADASPTTGQSSTPDARPGEGDSSRSLDAEAVARALTPELALAWAVLEGANVQELDVVAEQLAAAQVAEDCEYGCRTISLSVDAARARQTSYSGTPVASADYDRGSITVSIENGWLSRLEIDWWSDKPPSKLPSLNRLKNYRRG